MGKYSQGLASRLRTRGPKEGYCAICGTFGRLTRDHVPPKGCGNVEDQELWMIPRSDSEKPLESQGGTHFRTLCNYCNGDLLGGTYDKHLIAWSQELSARVSASFEKGLYLPEEMFCIVQSHMVARAIIGHCLAACAVDEVLNPPLSAPFPDSLKRYFLDEQEPLPPEVEIYYWLYPFRQQVIIKNAAKKKIKSKGIILGHVLKFFPLAFWVVWEKPEDLSINLNRLVTDKSTSPNSREQIVLNLNNRPPGNFPERPEDDELFMLRAENSLIGNNRGT